MAMAWIWTGMVLLALGAAVLTGQTGALPPLTAPWTP